MTSRWCHCTLNRPAHSHTLTLTSKETNSLELPTDDNRVLWYGVVVVGLLLLTAIKTERDWAPALKKELREDNI